MSLRFHRRLKVLPGIYLNISKNGVSTTIGPRGANINIGKSGVYLNTGIPGTGLSNRQKLSGGGSGTQPANTEIPTPVDENGIPDPGQEIITSEGLKGLQEHLEDARKERDTLANEIKQAEDNLNQLRTDLNKKQSGLRSIFTKKEAVENLQKDVDEASTDLAELTTQFDESRADINIQFDVEIEEQYKRVSDAFIQLTQSQIIWDITNEIESREAKSSAKTTVERKEVRFKLDNINYIKSKHPAFHLQNANGSELFIYPAFILLVSGAGAISLIDLKDLTFNFKQQRFIEPKESIPTDSKIIDYTWAKVNKDGSPDLRFSGNYQTPVVRYGAFYLTSSNGLNESYNISNFEAAESFAKEFLSYLSGLKNGTVQANNPVFSSSNITQKYFDTVKEFGNSFISFIKRLKNDKQFINTIYQSPAIKAQPFTTSDELLNFFFILDLMKCFSMTADITDLKSKEAFALLYMIANQNKLNFDSYATINSFYDPKLMALYANMYQSLKVEIEKAVDDDAMFRFSLLLSVYDNDLQKEYLSNVYRFASIVVKADGTVTKEEEATLKRIMSLSEEKKFRQTPNEQKQKEEGVKAVTQGEQQTLEDVLEELNSLTGLDAVKEEIKSLINFIKIQKAREATGLKSSSISYHIVFTGNPGTGKTTVARIVSQIYRSLGVLAQGQLVETDRSGMVAEYLGQTAVKVNKTVDSALNGVLFIDEAYSLVGQNQDDFGKEAVATLIKRMEDDRDKLVVVLAGYTNEMKTFIDTNPGFKSRFNRYIDFIDYTPDELLAIFEGLCKKLDYTLSGEAKNKLSELFSVAYSSRDKSFGNGRFVRNVFEKSLEKQANRIASVTNLTKEILTSIIAEDIPVI